MLEEVIARYSTAKIIATDQGSHLASDAFTYMLKEQNIRITMDEKGSWRDDVFV